MSLIERLATFALADPAGAQGARAVMRLSLADWAAVALAGRGEKVARILRGQALVEGGRGEATLIGAQARVPARAASLVNGATGHALDYDDTHFGHIGHPSVAVIPAALAMSEVAGADGARMLDAALIGAEASVRIGLWLGRGHYEAGFHQTATAGAFGATIAAGRLIGLDPEAMKQALAIAATRAAGLKSQFGTMGKPYHAGMAAETGVQAALLARAGFVSAPDQALDGAQGFGPTHRGAGAREALDGLGREWLMESVSHKFHACCHGTHAALEALVALAVEPGEVAQVDELVITTHPRWLGVCDIATARTGLELKFSYRATAAMALMGHDTARLASFSDALAQDGTLRALAQRVRVETDPDLAETASRLRVKLKNGAVREAAHDLDQRLPLAERNLRIRGKLAALLGQDADRLWALTQVDGGPDLPGLTELLARPQEA